MTLDRELKYFEDHKAELLQHHENQFALIRGEELAGTFTTEQEAYEAGLQKFGNTPFLIKPVLREERVAHIPALTLGLL
ncbi:MAG: hypothetical protein ACRD2T_11795 [Thermoanaerobaculia bacterium]